MIESPSINAHCYRGETLNEEGALLVETGPVELAWNSRGAAETEKLGAAAGEVAQLCRLTLVPLQGGASVLRRQRSRSPRKGSRMEGRYDGYEANAAVNRPLRGGARAACQRPVCAARCVSQCPPAGVGGVGALMRSSGSSLFSRLFLRARKTAPRRISSRASASEDCDRNKSLSSFCFQR